jgi:hypothetical protein
MMDRLKLAPVSAFLSVLCVLPVTLASAASQRPEKPNIILILSDDLGLQDVKCYDIERTLADGDAESGCVGEAGRAVLAGLFTCADLCALACCDLKWGSSSACADDACQWWQAAASASSHPLGERAKWGHVITFAVQNYNESEGWA